MENKISVECAAYAMLDFIKKIKGFIPIPNSQGTQSAKWRNRLYINI